MGSQNDDTDLPEDDALACTLASCSGGVPSQASVAAGVVCAENGGTVCDGGTACVACNEAKDCPAPAEPCKAAVCTAHACGVADLAAGAPATTQTAGDCQVVVCDAVGATSTKADDGDTPLDDGNTCTTKSCVAGTPTFTPTAPGTPCTDPGGTSCNGAGVCLSACKNTLKDDGETDIDCGGTLCDGCGLGKTCVTASDCLYGNCSAGKCAGPTAVGTVPFDGAPSQTTSRIGAVFDQPMDPLTLVGQTKAGPCTGTIQYSKDSFATCLAFSTAPVVLSADGKTGTLAPTPALPVNTLYKVRVTTGAKSVEGAPIAAALTQKTGFKTDAANSCRSSVMISQVYAPTGLAKPTYNRGYIELRNRGAEPVSLKSLSLQVGNGTDTPWTAYTLANKIVAPGGYYLIAVGAAGAVGQPLPTPDQTIPALKPVAASGMLALVTGLVPLTGVCPTATVRDRLAWGTAAAAPCFEGAAPAGSPDATNAITRGGDACLDTNQNGTDFTKKAPAPRTLLTPATTCTCSSAAVNETDLPVEFGRCSLDTPTDVTAAAGTTTTISTQAFEPLLTELDAAKRPTWQILVAPTGTPLFQEGGWTLFQGDPADAIDTPPSGESTLYYARDIEVPSVPGVYDFVVRFSDPTATQWTYCDANGAGTNPGLLYQRTAIGKLTVTP